MSTPRNLGAFADNVASTGKLNIAGINATGTPSSTTALKGDGTWGTVDSLPTQTGNSGKFLTTDGSAASWGTLSSLPTQTGNSGKFLTTDGTTSSWSGISRTLSVVTNAGSTTSISLSLGVVPILTNGGTTTNVTLN